METIHHRRGTKSFTGQVNGDRVTFRCPCEVFDRMSVVVQMTREQADALVNGGKARVVLAGQPREVIELFSSGMTPAEFELAYGRDVRPVADYLLYCADPSALGGTRIAEGWDANRGQGSF